MPKKPEEQKPESSSTPYAPASSTPDASASGLSASEASASVPPVEPPVKKSAAQHPSAQPSVVQPPAPLPYAAQPPAAQPPAAQPPSAQPPADLPYGAPAPYQVGPQKPPTTLSLLAMIFGIVGVALACCYGAGFLFAVAGIVLGHLGRKRETAQGMALTGMITGYAGAALSLIMWVFLILAALSPLLFLPFMTNDWS